MLSNSELARALCALALATIMAARGRRKSSLSRSGAAAAFLVGFLTWVSSVRFGATLIIFYLTSTRATRYKAEQKRRIEDGYTSEGGNRSAGQVFASSLPAVSLSLFYVGTFRHDAPIMSTFPARSGILLMYLLFFAACAGDTFASELGIVLPKHSTKPVLITAPWRRVPRGTNGGVSWQGNIASAVGGLVMGAVYFLTGPEWSWSQMWLLVVGIVGGVVGSGLDSVIGAIAQASWLDTASGKVLKEVPDVGEEKDERYVHICGMDLLNGEMVNVMAGVVTTGLAPVLLRLFSVSYGR